METFCILYAVFLILYLLLKGLASIGKGVGKALLPESAHHEGRNDAEPEKEGDGEYESLVFDIRKYPDPQATFLYVEKLILQLVSMNEEKMQKASDPREILRLQKTIDGLKSDLSDFRSQYQTYKETSD